MVKGKRKKKAKKIFSTGEGNTKSVGTDDESNSDENEINLTTILEVPDNLEMIISRLKSNQEQ